MENCPACGGPLTEQRDALGMFWQCAACAGRAMTVVALRRRVEEAPIDALWQASRPPEVPRDRPCPACSQPMKAVAIPLAGHPVALDVCSSCELVWFDPREYEALPLLPAPPPVPETERIARQAEAVAQVEEVGRLLAANDEPEPDSGWKMIPAFLGLPVEEEDPLSSTTPWVTWGVAAVVCAISLYATLSASWLVATLGFIPAQAGRYAGLTFITAFFVHAGLIHLLGNMYFFIMLGNNVEDYLGPGRYALLLLAATVAGNLAHLAGQITPELPCVGASGGIAGVMACYALAYPEARFDVFSRWGFGLRRIPAYSVMGLWISLQIFGAWKQYTGFTHVSSLAHLGGALAGLLCFFCWRQPPELPATPLPTEAELEQKKPA